MPEQKFFEMEMQIINGEYTYDYGYLIIAEDQEDAERIAEEHARGFYGPISYDDDNVYYFHGGEVAVRGRGVCEIDLAEYCKKQINQRMLGGPLPNLHVKVDLPN